MSALNLAKQGLTTAEKVVEQNLLAAKYGSKALITKYTEFKGAHSWVGHAENAAMVGSLFFGVGEAVGLGIAATRAYSAYKAGTSMWNGLGVAGQLTAASGAWDLGQITGATDKALAWTSNKIATNTADGMEAFAAKLNDPEGKAKSDAFLKEIGMDRAKFCNTTHVSYSAFMLEKNGKIDAKLDKLENPGIPANLKDKAIDAYESRCGTGEKTAAIAEKNHAEYVKAIAAIRAL